MVAGQTTLAGRRLDSFVRSSRISLDGINAINIDGQGAESLVLTGLGGLIALFDVVVAELNWVETYVGATDPVVIDCYLVCHGFRRAFTSYGYPQGSGVWVRSRSRRGGLVHYVSDPRFLNLVTRCGLAKWLQRSGLRSVLRSAYYRWSARRPAS